MNSALNKQRGAVLVVSLVLLLMMTILAITAASTSSLQSRMAGNAQDMNLAFQAAESGLARWVQKFETSPALVIEGDLGGASIDSPGVLTQASCLNVEGSGSLGTTGFIFTCYHVTSTGRALASDAVATHQMGYMNREGQ